MSATQKKALSKSHAEQVAEIQAILRGDFEAAARHRRAAETMAQFAAPEPCDTFDSW